MRPATFILLGLALVNTAIAEDRSLFFSIPTYDPVPMAEMPLKVKQGQVRLFLVVRTRSPAEAGSFPTLVVDDYRYDMPGYFADGRVPNVRFEAEVKRNGSFIPIPVTVWSSGPGGSDEKLFADINFQLRRDPESAKAQRKLRADVDAGKIKPEEWLKSLKSNEPVEQANRPGIYRLRAVYQPDVQGKWKGELSTKPIEIVIE